MYLKRMPINRKLIHELKRRNEDWGIGEPIGELHQFMVFNENGRPFMLSATQVKIIVMTEEELMLSLYYGEFTKVVD